MKPEKLIGKKAEIIDRNSSYFGHWGYIKLFDGDVYHIEGGSISLINSGLCPVFDRDQFRVKRVRVQ